MTPVRPTTHQGQQGTQEVTDHLNPAPEEEVAGGNGLSHDGGSEVEVIEEGHPVEEAEAGARWFRHRCHGKPFVMGYKN